MGWFPHLLLQNYTVYCQGLLLNGFTTELYSLLSRFITEWVYYRIIQFIVKVYYKMGFTTELYSLLSRFITEWIYYRIIQFIVKVYYWMDLLQNYTVYCQGLLLNGFTTELYSLLSMFITEWVYYRIIQFIVNVYYWMGLLQNYCISYTWLMTSQTANIIFQNYFTSLHGLNYISLNNVISSWQVDADIENNVLCILFVNLCIVNHVRSELSTSTTMFRSVSLTPLLIIAWRRNRVCRKKSSSSSSSSITPGCASPRCEKEIQLSFCTEFWDRLFNRNSAMTTM